MRTCLFCLFCLLAGNMACGVMAAEAPAERLIYHPPLAEGDFAKIDLSALTVRLIDVLKKMNVETDPSDPQFGMIYET